jgi:hypothetical protein
MRFYGSSGAISSRHLGGAGARQRAARVHEGTGCNPVVGGAVCAHRRRAEGAGRGRGRGRGRPPSRRPPNRRPAKTSFLTIRGGQYIYFGNPRFEYVLRFGDVLACFILSGPLLAHNVFLINRRFGP